MKLHCKALLACLLLVSAYSFATTDAAKETQHFDIVDYDVGIEQVAIKLHAFDRDEAFKVQLNNSATETFTTSIPARRAQGIAPSKYANQKTPYNRQYRRARDGL